MFQQLPKTTRQFILSVCVVLGILLASSWISETNKVFLYGPRQTIYEHFKTPDDIVGSVKVPPLRTFMPYLAVPLYTATPRFIVNVPLDPFIAPLFILPSSIIAPSQYKSHVLPPRDQGHCGSCWAFALTDHLSTVLLRTSQQHKALSPEFLLQCYNTNGCNGDSPEKAALWCQQQHSIIPYENNAPYKSGSGITVPEKTFCSTKSSTGVIIYGVYSITTYQNEDRYRKDIIRDNVENMKAAIFTYGSIYACMSIREDFFSFLGDIPYKPPRNSKIIGGHAIEIIGYTKDTWICRGAWPNWPLLAKHPNEFEIPMGQNYCGIESRCGLALPQIYAERTEPEK